VAAAASGIPSTALAVQRRELGIYTDHALTAASALLGAESWPKAPRWVAGAAVHAAVSLWWTAVLGAVLPRRRPVVNGAVAGFAIAALDLGVVGRRIPAVRALSPGPQIADHIAFGVVAALGLRYGARRITLH